MICDFAECSRCEALAMLPTQVGREKTHAGAKRPALQSTTLVSGFNVLGADSAGTVPGVHLSSGASAAFAFAPAIEYNWCSSMGVLLGVRLVPRGLNTAASVAPAIAINIVR